MMNPVNKRHWYDGFIYDKILAPNQKGSFRRISELIDEGSDIIDIGCGTGRLAFRLSGKCRSITAIDLSDKNINTAKVTIAGNPAGNITFLHTSLSEFISKDHPHFDYAVLSYIIHEVTGSERLKILSEAASVSSRIIVSDHKSDTNLLATIIREVMEFMAGSDHYSCYRSYINSNGLNGISKEAGLKIVHQETYKGHLQISVLEPD